ncbi:MAG: hypothetical protein QOD25_2325 [Alphaproteobacteria bacterium]|jgi:hypothetical protein|nr:hypothetical protein [Alphaproteobacteria bacterium]
MPIIDSQVHAYEARQLTMHGARTRCGWCDLLDREHPAKVVYASGAKLD